MSHITVRRITRFPVKSMGGERLEGARVTDLGITGDRAFGLRDLGTGKVLTARRTPALLFASARWSEEDGGRAHVTLPEGTVVTSDQPDRDEILSTWLGRKVRLERAGGEGGTYESPQDAENDTDWATWQGPGGAWHDSTRSRVSLVGAATLREWDERRFRTNLLLEGGESGAEDDWVEHSLTVGSEVVLDVRKRIDRCVMVTRPLPGQERDLDVLRTINTERERCLAIGAMVSTGGVIRVGDTVTPR
ncbi:hypothetical protein GCM10027020_02380 [Nocardioides salsibiostraticola]